LKGLLRWTSRESRSLSEDEELEREAASFFLPSDDFFTRGLDCTSEDEEDEDEEDEDDEEEDEDDEAESGSVFCFCFEDELEL